MATIQGSYPLKTRGVIQAMWEHLTETNADGSWLEAPDFPDKTVEVFGNFGTSGSVQIEAPGDGSTPLALNDSRGEGSPMAFTAADVRVVNENPRKIRPRVTAGTGVDVTVVITATGKV